MTIPYRLLAPLFAALLLSSCVSTDLEKLGPAKAPDTTTKAYDLYTGDGMKPGDSWLKLQVFRHPRTGREVRLIGMCHIADAAFYRDVQQELDKADIVLMEGVGHELDDPLLGLSMTYLFACMDRARAEAGLYSQHMLENHGNWVSADLSMDEMFGGETLPERYGIAAPMALAAPFIETGLLLCDLRRTVAGAVCGDRGTRSALAGMRHEVCGDSSEEKKKKKDERRLSEDETEKIILAKRNKRVMQVLDMASRNYGIRRIVIPWGAAHGPGLEEMLLARGYQKKESRWLRAVAVRGILEDKTVKPPPGVRIPYVFTWNKFGNQRMASAACSAFDWKQNKDFWAFEFGYGLVFNAEAGRMGGGFALLPPLFTHGLMTRENAEGMHSNFSLCGKLLSWQRMQKPEPGSNAQPCTAFSMQPLCYTRSTAKGNAFTLSPLLTQISHDAAGTHLGFDPYHVWPLLSRDESGLSWQILWPLVDMDRQPKGGMKRFATLAGWLTDFRRLPSGGRYDSVLKGVLFEKKRDDAIRYFRVLNLFSRSTDTNSREYSVLWPLVRGKTAEAGEMSAIFPFYSMERTREKNGQENKSELTLLPLGILFSRETDAKAGKQETECLWGILYHASAAKAAEGGEERVNRVLLGSLGLDNKGGRKSLVVLWIPVWHWGKEAPKAADTQDRQVVETAKAG